MKLYWSKNSSLADSPALSMIHQQLSAPLVRRMDDLLLNRCLNCNGLFVDPCALDAALLELYTTD